MNKHSLPVPPLWIGLALVFWGVMTDQIALALVLAAIAEFGAVSPVKWELTSAHFYRVADATSALFALVAIYQFNEYSIYAIYRILALLPVCVFPLLVAERYSTLGTLPLSALFLSLRRRVREGFDEERFVGIAAPYVVIVALAASATERAGLAYFAGVFVLVLGFLFVQRSQRYGAVSWCATVAAVAITAFALQSGVRATQSRLEDSFSYWVNQFAWLQTDPQRELTSIGSIGRLKLSDRIRVRVTAPLSMPIPLALREASYSTFNLGMWKTAGTKAFAALDPLPETTTWHLGQDAEVDNARHASIVVDHHEDVGVAPLPYGTYRLNGSELIEVQQNRYNTTLVEALPGQLEYHVAWRDQPVGIATPTDDDMAIPDNYRGVIGQVADEIGLVRDDPAFALRQVRGFFNERFRYSLIQKGFYPGRTPLAHFLLEERKGHCEYFATATALLLRHAGIPTRYAVGYMVYEYSTLEKSFVARARHAHSWVEAYVDGYWTFVDTTPGEWNELESANVSRWQAVQDVWSWIANRYLRYQRSEHRALADTALWFVPPLLVYLLWRLRKRARNIALAPGRPPVTSSSANDSELYDLLRDLQRDGYAIAPGETLRTYLTRHLHGSAEDRLLGRLLALHERYRFSSAGLSVAEREELSRGCKRLRASTGSSA